MQLIKIFLCILLVSGCTHDEVFVDYGTPIEKPKPTIEKCVSDFMTCESYADLILGDGPGHINGTWVISAYFPGDDTGLSFFLEGPPDEIEGKIRLNDTRTERSRAPYAIRVVSNSDTDVDHEWRSMGDTVDVLFFIFDFVKIVYDINTFVRGAGKEMRYKGEIIAPILARCFNDTGEGTGTGVLDPDFSSEFCSPFKKHRHQF